MVREWAPTVLSSAFLAVAVLSLICWILTLVKMFKDEQDGGIAKGIAGMLCGIWAFVWGWMYVGKHDHRTIMIVWTGAFIASVIINGLFVIGLWDALNNATGLPLGGVR